MQPLILLQQPKKRRMEGNPKEIVPLHALCHHTSYALFDLREGEHFLYVGVSLCQHLYLFGLVSIFHVLLEMSEVEGSDRYM